MMVEHQSRIGHRAGHRANMGQRSEGARRIGGHAPEALLEAENTREAGGNADRAAAVGAEMQRPHAAGSGHRSTSAGPARRQGRVPGIAGYSGERGIRDALPAELRRRRLAQQDGAFLAQARDGRARHHASAVRIDGLRAAQRRPALGQQQILDPGRHAIDAGPCGSPLAQRASDARGRTSAPASSTKRKALRRGFRRLDRGQAPPCRLDRRERLRAIVGDKLDRRAGSCQGEASHRSRDGSLAASATGEARLAPAERGPSILPQPLREALSRRVGGSAQSGGRCGEPHAEWYSSPRAQRRLSLLAINLSVLGVGVGFGALMPLVALRLPRPSAALVRAVIGLNAAMSPLAILLVGPCLPRRSRGSAACARPDLGAPRSSRDHGPAIAAASQSCPSGSCCACCAVWPPPSIPWVVSETWLNLVATRARSRAGHGHLCHRGWPWIRHRPSPHRRSWAPKDGCPSC